MDEPGKLHPMSEGSLVPIPDPTALTTTALNQAISSLKELIEARFVCVEKDLLSMDRRLAEAPVLIDNKLALLKDLSNERLAGIHTKFEERDGRASQALRDLKGALEISISAAKELAAEHNSSSAMAVAKAEMATTKQIDSQSLVIQTSTHALESKIDDIKERLALIEGGAGGGVRESKTSQHNSNSFVIAVIGIIIGMGGLVVAIITNMSRHS